MPRGFVASDQDQQALLHDALIVQAFAIDLCVAQNADEIVLGGASTPIADHLHGVLGKAQKRVLQGVCAFGRRGRREQLVGPAKQLIPVFGGYAQHVPDQDHGKRSRDLPHEFAFALLLDRVHQRVADLANLELLFLHATRREATVDKVAATLVNGVVHVDHRWNRRGIGPGTLARTEEVGTLRNGKNVFVKGHTEDLPLRVVVHRGVLTHPPVRVQGPGLVEGPRTGDRSRSGRANQAWEGSCPFDTCIRGKILEDGKPRYESAPKDARTPDPRWKRYGWAQPGARRPKRTATLSRIESPPGPLPRRKPVDPTAQSEPHRPADSAVVSSAYARYALGLLCVVYVVNFVDRQVLSILLQSIKDDLGLSDAQLGLLSGTAFGIFYATLGVPIARLADTLLTQVGDHCLPRPVERHDGAMRHRNGLCQSADLPRGCRRGRSGRKSRPSHSLISDYFPEERRGTALGIFSLGVPIGILIGFLAGGWLDETLGWRTAFLVVGLPGLLIAVLVATTLREPPRGGAEGDVASATPVTTAKIIRFLWNAPSFRYTALGSGLYAFVGYTTVTWAPSYLMRTYGMESGEVGTWLSLIIGIGGAIGVYSGGALSDAWAEPQSARAPLCAGPRRGVRLPFSIPVFLVDSAMVSLAFLTVPATLGMMYQGPAFAVTQSPRHAKDCAQPPPGFSSS